MDTDAKNSNAERMEPPVKILEEKESLIVDEQKDLSKNFNSDLDSERDIPNNKVKKSGNNGPIICIILLVFLGVLAYFGYNEYKKFTKDPSDAFKAVIENAYKNFSEGLKPYKTSNKSEFNILKDSMVVKGGLSFKSDSTPKLEQEKINVLLGLDYAKREAELGVGLSKKEENLADLSVYFKNDSMYTKSSTLLDNTYVQKNYDFDEMFDLSSFEEFKNSSAVNIEDIDYIVRELKEVLIESLNKDYMTNKKETLNIDEEIIEVDKITYKLDKESCKNLSKTIVEKILENDNLIEKISKISGKSTSEIEDDLDSIKDSDIYEDIEDSSGGEFVIYTKGINYELVKFELNFGTNSLSGEFKDSKKTFSLDVDGDTYKVIIDEKDNGYTIDIKQDDNSLVYLFIKTWKKNLIEFEYNIDYDDIDLNGYVKLNMSDTGNKKNSGVFELKTNGNIGREKIDFNIVFDYEVSFGDKICRDDVSNTLDGSEFTEEDQLKMSEKLKALEETEIFKYFEDIMGSSSNNLIPDKTV